MIADITITEKSFGDKSLMSGVRFSLSDDEKVGIIGRNGVGKSTLFAILSGSDTDFTGDVIYRKNVSIVSTAQEHTGAEQTVMAYILDGLPEYASLAHIIHTYPETMGDDMKLITEYSEALARFEQKGFYEIEQKIERELEAFGLGHVAPRQLATLSGGQKRLVEVVKVMHADAQLALLDEPTNHMDFVAKQQFIDWMNTADQAMCIITHDRDVLAHVDRIVEIKDGVSHSFSGNYAAYLTQNAHSTGAAMNDYATIQRRIENLKTKVTNFRRLKERARDPDTIKQFKRREQQATDQLAELEQIEKPTFWIDRESTEALHHKTARHYQSFKAKNIRMNVARDESNRRKLLARARDLSLGYEAPLFGGVSFDLRETESLELRGRNGAGKTTLIQALLAAGRSESTGSVTQLDGELSLDQHVRVGVYEQEISPRYFEHTLAEAIDMIYAEKNLSLSETKRHQLLRDYLFTAGDADVMVARLSGGQKARLQIIDMLAHDPELLILDEPTNHLDLPSIEELEQALSRYSGAILYVSHDSYFRSVIGGEVVVLEAA